MTTDLSDAAILARVETALRVLGEGRASIAMAGDWLIREIIGLQYEAPPRGASDPFRTLGDDAE